MLLFIFHFPRRFLASRDFVLNVPLRAVNAVAWVLRLPPLPLWRTDIPPNSARIMDVLMKVMGHQVRSEDVSGREGVIGCAHEGHGAPGEV